jgi:hypothetical protein
MVDSPASKGAHEKTKPLAVMDYHKYKIGVDKSDQLLAYCSFQSPHSGGKNCSSASLTLFFKSTCLS